jgi:predicted NBD/HSP70 family sugar kinase
LPLRLASDLIPSTLARLIASGAAETQSELITMTGLARSSCASTITELLDAGVLRPGGMKAHAGRGRPSQRLVLSASLGTVLIVDLRPDSARLTVHDLGQRLLAECELGLDIASGPRPTVRLITEAASRLRGGIAELPDGDRPGPLRAAAVGVPAPVDPTRGVCVRPPIMPGWDGFGVSEAFASEWGCPVVVQNDSSLRALGEARYLPPDQSPLVFIDVGVGIGAGVITERGAQYLGAQGGAGDIGHTRVPGARDVPCTCGKTGCVEAVASAPAILRRLGSDAPADLPGLYAAIGGGEPEVIRVLRDAAETLGEAIANLVHLLNPARVTLNGPLVEVSDDLLAIVRGVVYQRALPLATRSLVLNPSALGPEAATCGGVVLATEHALDMLRVPD